MSDFLFGLKGVAIPLWGRVFPSWLNLIKKELSDCDTVLDLGCGYDSPIQHCNVSFSVGVELFTPYCKKQKGRLFTMNILKRILEK